jgi:hypothetical protein
VAGIVVNRLGRTRDAAYWDDQLRQLHPDLVIEPSVRLRAAVAEAAAQSTPVHALTRDGASAAAAEFDQLAGVLGIVEPTSVASDPAPQDTTEHPTDVPAEPGADVAAAHTAPAPHTAPVAPGAPIAHAPSSTGDL